MARRINTASPNRLVRLLTAPVAFLALVGAGAPLAAQDQQPATRLEDLIPDTAVSDPDAWAKAIAQPDVVQNSPSNEAEESSPAADSPMAEFPEIEVPWPDETPDLPQLAPLERDPDIRFADVTTGDDTAAPVLEDARVIQIGTQLTLAFPRGDDAFPDVDAFVDRFKALSNIENLSGKAENLAQFAARARADGALLDQLLEIYGYYDALVIRSVNGTRRGGDRAERTPTVRFDIIPGTRFRFGAIDLGNLNDAPDAAELRGAFAIQTGDPLSSDAIVRGQFDLDQALGESGYPFAEIRAPELLVDHDRAEGDLAMIVLPKGKYVIGDVLSDQPEFLSGKHIGTIARFESGDLYQHSLVFDLRRAITATGLVSSVAVTPREVSPPTETAPGVVALDVALTKARLRTIAGAIGYGSDEGFKLQASWEHRNLFPPEGSLRVRGIAGTQEQLGGVTFRKNNFGGRDRILTLDAYATKVKRPAYFAKTASLLLNYERISTLLFQKPLTWGGGLELIATDEREAKIKGGKSPNTTYLIAALPLAARIDSSDSLLDPKKGFRLAGHLSPEFSRQTGFNSVYLRAQFDGSYYQSISDGVVVAGRARAATIVGAQLSRVAPSRRYYAGGGSSVRGYGYQQIGPRNGVGEPNGGLSLVELSFEARVHTGLMDGAVSLVPFIDAGSVSRNAVPDFKDVKYGAGLGLRYQTGFGPIRVDVGVPLNPASGDSPVAVYVSLGQAF